MIEKIIDSVTAIVLSGDLKITAIVFLLVLLSATCYVLSVMLLNQRLSITKHKKCMDAIDETMKKLKPLLWNDYQAIVKSREDLPNDFIHSIEGQYYEMIVDAVLLSIKSNFIERLKKKKLEGMAVSDVGKWIGDEIDEDIKNSEGYFDKKIHEDSLISRDELKVNIPFVFGEIRRHGRELYKELQDIIEKYKPRKIFKWGVSI